MKSSNLVVNCAMRSRRSSKPKFMLGRVSAMEGALAEERGGRIVLVESDVSNIAAILMTFRGLGLEQGTLPVEINGDVLGKG